MAFRIGLLCRKESLKWSAVFLDPELVFFFFFLQSLYIPSLIWHLLQCSRTRSKRGQIVAKRSVSSLGDRTVESEDSPESMGSGSSSEDEVSVMFKPPTPPLFSFLLIPYRLCILRC
jgi:hypothetical protein